MRSILLFNILLIITLSSCLFEGAGCDEDCPGVIGTNGQFYCNDCNARRDGQSVADHIEDFYWKQTQCADPWGEIDSASLIENYHLVNSYLANQDIEVYLDTFHYYDEALDEVCEECTCLTGNVIVVYAASKKANELLALGFSENYP